MKKRIIVALIGSLFILSAWIFVPERNEESFVVNYFEDKVKVYELQAGEESVQEEVRNEPDGVFYEITRRNKKLEQNGRRRRGEYCAYLEPSVEGGLNEQETSEETGETVLAEPERVILDSSTTSESYSVAAQETWVSSEPETVAYEIESQTTAETVETTQVEECGNTDIHGLLRQQLAAAGIEWWYPYAVAQMTQESQCNPWAENPNGLDKGLFQYRITYWTQPESIFDVNAQIRVYVGQVQARLAAGLSIEETISRHFTSDYITEVNWQYVNDVLRWMN